MQNEPCIIVNANTGLGYSHLKFDRNINLINNIRIWVNSSSKEMGYFFTQSDLSQIRTDRIPVIKARCLNSGKIIELDPGKVLAEQLPGLAPRELAILELNAGGYKPGDMNGIPTVSTLDVMKYTTELANVEPKGEETEVSDRSMGGNDGRTPKDAGIDSHQGTGSHQGKNSDRKTDKDSEQGTSAGPGKKKKGRWKVILLLILLLAVGVEGYLVLNPGIVVKGQLFLGKTEEAIASYNNRVAGKEKQEISVNPDFEKLIEAVQTSYMDGRISLEDARQQLELYMNLDNPYLKGRISGILDEINSYAEAREIYAQAEEYLGAGKYEDAFRAYSSLKDNDTFYQNAQTQLATCVQKLVDGLGATDTAEACMDALSTLDSYIAVNEMAEFTAKRQEIEQTLSNISTNEVRTGIIQRVDLLEASGDYASAFEAIEEGFRQIPGDKVLAEKQSSCRDNYVKANLKLAEDAVAREEYISAETTLTAAISLYDDGSLQKKLTEIQEIVAQKMAVYTAPKAKTSQCKGTIADADSKKTYSFVPEVSGRYVFTAADMVYGLSVRVAVVDKSGETIAYDYLKNDQYMYCSLNANEKYSIVVTHSYQTGDFTLNITHRKPDVDISLNEAVKDQMEAGHQFIEYVFTPVLDGYYSFSFSDMLYEMQIKIEIQDPLNKPIVEDYVKNDQYVNTYMTGGTTYRIMLTQERTLGDFTMKIGKQTPEETITASKTKQLIMNFGKEHKYLTFTPSTTGTYLVKVNNMRENCAVRVIVKDSLEKPLTDQYLRNDGYSRFDAAGGDTYYITIIQDNGYSSFDFTVLRDQ